MISKKETTTELVYETTAHINDRDTVITIKVKRNKRKGLSTITATVNDTHISGNENEDSATAEKVKGVILTAMADSYKWGIEWKKAKATEGDDPNQMNIFEDEESEGFAAGME